MSREAKSLTTTHDPALRPESLVRALRCVKKATLNKSALEILSCVRLDYDPETMTLKATGTTLEYSIVAEIDSAPLGSEAFSLCVSLNPLLRWARYCSEPIEIDHQQEHGVLFRSGMSTLRLRRFPAEDFPTIRFPDPAWTTTVQSIDLQNAFGTTLVSVALEDTHPVLSGVSIASLDGYFEVAAADGFRLHIRQMPRTDYSEQRVDGKMHQVIVPRRAVSVITSLAAMLRDRSVSLCVGETAGGQRLFQASFDRVTLVTILIEGTFPNYMMIVPKEPTHEFQINREQLLQAVQQVDVSKTYVKIERDGDLDHSVLHLTAKDDGNHVSAAADVSISKETAKPKQRAFRLCMNPKYLIDVLRSFNSRELVVSTIINKGDDIVKRPIMFREPDLKDRQMGIVMPMHMVW
jgi:DNA polymerase-3 subunit beta